MTDHTKIVVGDAFFFERWDRVKISADDYIVTGVEALAGRLPTIGGIVLTKERWK